MTPVITLETATGASKLDYYQLLSCTTVTVKWGGNAFTEPAADAEDREWDQCFSANASKLQILRERALADRAAGNVKKIRSAQS